MKSVVFVYPTMMLGGSTTSLLSILECLDRTKFQTDLLLGFSGGPWVDDVPSDIRLLPPAHLYQDKKERILRRLLSPRYMLTWLYSRFLAKKWKSTKQGNQWFEAQDVDFYRDLEKEYDVAVAFLEGQQCKYVANHVKAKKKIAWIHVDYKAGNFRPKLDLPSLSCFDTIVTVSEECRKNFCEAFPTLADRCVMIENILSGERLNRLAEKPIDFSVDSDKINLVTTCRISFSAKGLDRAVKAFERLKSETDISDLRWYILGDGGDRPALEQMIADAGLRENIVLLGIQQNPYPYLKQMSMFFLPSRWEGKPMAVTEAFILGLPALVTHYASAPEQIRDGIDGKIVENSESGVYEGLKYVLEHRESIAAWKENVQKTDYSNVQEIHTIEKIMIG